MSKLSVALATRNEEQNIGSCLESIKDIADEIVVVDEESSDKTREIVKEYGARVIVVKHEPIFHINKQKALDAASGDWILQLDADEIVRKELGDEIKKVIKLNYSQVVSRKFDRKKERLFKKHFMAIEKRDGKIGKKSGEIVAFFIPRRNFFLGKPLTYAGLYPDGVIRLVKKNKARFPCKNVHEQMIIDGEVAWLSNDLIHNDSPALSKYFARLNRYTDLQAEEMKQNHLSKNIFNLLNYIFIMPTKIFFSLIFIHKGILDGTRGFLWSMFSSWHYPIAYFKYWQIKQ